MEWACPTCGRARTRGKNLEDKQLAMDLEPEIQVDALPYIDQEYEEPGLREAALQLIEEETKKYRSTKNYLIHLPNPRVTFETPLIKQEMDRLASRLPMESLSMKRYELPQPGAAQKNDVLAWRDSVNNSSAQLEHQSGRIINLELLSQYGSNEWKIYNEQLTKMAEREANILRGLKNNIQEINWQRKTEQTNVGARLNEYNTHWSSLIHKNFELGKVCVELNMEVEGLRQQAVQKGIPVE